MDAAVVPCAAGAGDIYAALGCALADAAFVCGAHDGRGPFAEDAFRYAGEGLAGASCEQRDDGALVAVVERAGAEGVAQLRGELRIRAEARIEFAVNFADDAGARVFRDAFGEQALDLSFDRGDDAFDGGGVGGVEEGELRFVCGGAIRGGLRVRGRSQRRRPDAGIT